MHKRYLFLILVLAVAVKMQAQQDPVSFRLQMLAGYNGPDQVPFWIRSNQFGSVPPSGASLGMIGTVQKDYDQTKKRLAGWGFGVEGRLNAGNSTNFILTEGYGKFRLGIFELKAGRVKEITGLCDTLLTSGSWSVSGNALGIPKIQLAIPEFYTLPWFGKMFAFKGSYVHGWMGNWYINEKTIPNTPTYLHQKTLYGRLGKPSWKLMLYGGFNHQVVWGNERNILGRAFALNDFETFMYVNTGKPYNHDTIAETRIGNHLGSIDLGLTYDFPKFRLLIYRQNFYDAGALYYLANLLDGLNGISFENKIESGKTFQWKRLLIELLYTKNQAGEKWSRYTTSPFENYYNNGYYKQGWSYKGPGIGNPLVSPSYQVKDGFPAASWNYFSNNRVVAVHFGMEGSINKWIFLSKLSYSRNFGTYVTSATGKIYEGAVYPSPLGVFPTTGQFSGYIETKKDLPNNLQIGFTGAMDKGNLYKDSFSIMAVISKFF